MKYLRIALLAVGLALMAGSTVFLVVNHLRAAEARGWPRAPARIVESQVRTIHAQEIGNAGDFLPYVRYDYRVNGRTFHDDTIWLDERRSFDSANVAARELTFLGAGTQTEVMYNPADPAEAALIVEERAWPKIFLLLLGTLLAGLGWWLRRLRPPPAPGPGQGPGPGQMLAPA